MANVTSLCKTVGSNYHAQASYVQSASSGITNAIVSAGGQSPWGREAKRIAAWGMGKFISRARGKGKR